MTIFVTGLAKKLLIADTLASVADPIFRSGSPGYADAWVSMFLYAGQIYFDFWGYSDMAIGLGRLFGLEFPKNFDSPYRAVSFSDFWRRWHITFRAGSGTTSTYRLAEIVAAGSARSST